MEGLWERNPDMRELYGNARDYLVSFELCVISPHYSYKWHCDVDRKGFTGVVYWGKDGDGTVLKSGETCMQVNWKHNRGLWFSNHHPKMDTKDPLRPWHMYKNTRNKPRYTVNINFTPQVFINELIMNKKPQLEYCLNVGEPIWLSMGE